VKSKNVPQRTCIGCQVKKPKKELIKITLDSKGNIILDKNKQVGRGAYLCKSKSNPKDGRPLDEKVKSKCLEQAIKKNSFKYAFKKKKVKNIKAQISKVKISSNKTKLCKTANCNCNGAC